MKLLKFLGQIAAVSLLLGLVASCSEQDVPEVVEEEEVVPTYTLPGDYTNIEVSRAEQEYIVAQNDFALKVYRALAEQRDAKRPNIVASPVGTSMLMSIMAEGANGETQSQIINGLGFGDVDIEAVNTFNSRLAYELSKASVEARCDIANAFWFDNSLILNSDFLKHCKENYDLVANQVDLYTEGTRQEINTWVAEQTNNLIEESLKSIPTEDVKSILTNTVYFRGLWSDPFSRENTASGIFYNYDGTEGTANFMYRDYLGTGVEKDKYKAIGLPFGGGNFYMGFILPDPRYKLKEVMADIDAHEIIEEILCDNVATRIYLHLPKFEIENSHTNLSTVLSDLGITDAFTPNVADFSNLTASPYYIKELQQDVRLILDEEGVEAGAFTRITGGGGNHPIMVARFNVPFAFFIFESSTGAIIYVGDVSKL